MWVFFTFNVVHVNIYEAKRRYVFFSYLHYFYSCIYFFRWKPVTKTFCKSNWGWHLWKLLENLKGSEKLMLAKFYSNVDKKIWSLISNKSIKANDKFNIVTGQTEFRLVGWSFIKKHCFENFQSSRSEAFWKIVLLNISQKLQENICAAVFLIKM